MPIGNRRTQEVARRVVCFVESLVLRARVDSIGKLTPAIYMKKIKIEVAKLVRYDGLTYDKDSSGKGLTLIKIKELSEKFTRYQIIPKENEIISIPNSPYDLHLLFGDGEQLALDSSGKFKVIEVQYCFDQDSKYDIVLVGVVDVRIDNFDIEEINSWKEMEKY